MGQQIDCQVMHSKYIQKDAIRLGLWHPHISLYLVRPAGIEPAHPDPESGALSTELRAHFVSKMYYTINIKQLPVLLLGIS